jgi:hypothetical protein
MVKVFTPNKAGKIEFTKTELENLLNEVWLDGYNTNRFSWNSPAWTYVSSGVSHTAPDVTTSFATANRTDPYTPTSHVTVKLGDP